MMHLYSEKNQALTASTWDGVAPLMSDVVWIDLHNPTKQEEAVAEAFLKIALPTREEMREIEISNRLYQENGAQFMTATLVVKINEEEPESQAVTFVVADKVLVTIRYINPIPFKNFAAHIDRLPAEPHEGVTILLGLLDSIVNRLADVLEHIGQDIDSLTKCIFRREAKSGEKKSAPPMSLQHVLQRIGRCGDLVSKVHESLVTLERLSVYASNNKRMCLEVNDARMRAIRKDITGLNDHTSYLTNKVNFLLDATLGMLSIQQNNVFRVLSVASLIFMPPTLIAGVYGMNFKMMPELNWHWGYPLAVLMMAVSAVLPLAYLKQRKYL